jgi:flagellum-specific peptidoglycan hydrolase FlgJ
MLMLTITIWIGPEASAEDSIEIVVDGEAINEEPQPFIRDSRTLVPVRLISEKLGGEIIWDEQSRTVEIKKENKSVTLIIDSHLVKYKNGNEDAFYNLCDVAPQIVNGCTFIPVRLVSNALGVEVEWNNDTRTVIIDSAKTSDVTSFFDVKISSVKSGQVINGKTDLQTEIPKEIKGASEIKYLLINSNSSKGFVIGRGNNLSAKYNWLPGVEDNGEKILVAAIYDGNGKFLAGDSIPVKVNVTPAVSLTGLSQNETVSANSAALGANVNFSAAYVKYEMIHSETGQVYISPQVDPYGTFTMIPVMEDNGNMTIQVIAYDKKNNPYKSEKVNIKVDVDRYLELKGVSSDKAIDGQVTLSASRNFNVSETEYLMRDTETGAETILFKAGYGSYSWFPGPEMKGDKVLYVRVKDTAGNIYTSAPVNVKVIGSPKLLLQGIGPNQVVSGAVNLKYLSNATLSDVKYYLINSSTGAKKEISSSFTPDNTYSGKWKIKAEGIYNGNKIESEAVEFTIYMGKTYSAKPIIEKDKFLDLASRLSVNNMKKTGMSAALQTAQAILETGWGQSVPVDKYNGQFSYNLFGIKGTGSAGSVVSNTWEEYNGVAYRIDANFRAYNNVDESWEDNNQLLLTASRYSIYREVMYNSTQGAWALRRAGYATDSQYPIKLILLIPMIC